LIEKEWLNCTDSTLMLEFLEGKASDRKMRLFACGCCRELAVWIRLQDRKSRSLIELVERLADDPATWQEVGEVARTSPKGRAIGGSLSMGASKPVRLSLSSQAERAVLALSMEDAWQAASRTTQMASNLLGSRTCDLLREVIGNPFRPVTLAPFMLMPNVVTLAQFMYDGRDFDGMPQLAEALAMAGCTDEDLLQHCRQTSKHVRGCWVVDLLLDKK
jgi:hypothetical protein